MKHDMIWLLNHGWAVRIEKTKGGYFAQAEHNQMGTVRAHGWDVNASIANLRKYVEGKYEK